MRKISLLYYSGALVALALLAGVLGFVIFSGTTALVARLAFVMLFLLLIISFARRKKKGVHDHTDA